MRPYILILALCALLGAAQKATYFTLHEAEAQEVKIYKSDNKVTLVYAFPRQVKELYDRCAPETPNEEDPSDEEPGEIKTMRDEQCEWINTYGVELNVKYDVLLDTGCEVQVEAYMGQDSTKLDSAVLNNDRNVFRFTNFDHAACKGECNLRVVVYGTGDLLISHISTIVWFRAIKMNSDSYFYSNSNLPYMPIYAGKKTPPMAPSANNVRYFQFDGSDYFSNGETEKELYISAHTSDSDVKVVVFSGLDTNKQPTENSLAWVMTEETAMKKFVAGTNYLGVKASGPSDEYYQLEITDPSPASALFASALVLLAALAALLF